MTEILSADPRPHETLEGRIPVFIDRDGTMGGGYYVRTPQDYAPYKHTAEGFLLLTENGFAPIIITNQSCIARHLDFGYDFGREFRQIGAYDWFICPHDTADNCPCRKPKPGLYYAAQARYGMDFARSFCIGDRWSDMVSAGQLGCRLILVMTGRGRESVGIDREKWAAYEPVHMARTFYDAARWLVRQHAIETKNLFSKEDDHD